MVGELNRIAKSDNNLNLNPFKSIETQVKAYIILVLYIVVACLYLISTLMFSKSACVTLYVYG